VLEGGWVEGQRAEGRRKNNDDEVEVRWKEGFAHNRIL